VEKWLEYAEGTQSEQSSPPSNLEKLEDVILDYHEFMLDLDSHKNIVMNLNVAGTHLNEHITDEKYEDINKALSQVNKRWEKVCIDAEHWQQRLQNALTVNHELCHIIEDFSTWLQRIRDDIQECEPIDLTETTETIERKFAKVR